MTALADLYADHLRVLDEHLAKSLTQAAANGVAVDGLVLHAGRQATYHRDDELIAFRSTPHFRRFVPLLTPEHVVYARPGSKPLVVRVQPSDYWYDTSPPPPSYWEAAVDLREVADFEEVGTALGELGNVAYLGNSPEAAATLGIPEDRVEPEEILMPLDWYRAYKTAFEIELIRVAAGKASAGHRAGRDAFAAGASEREILFAYLQGSDQTEYEAPFDPIVALDRKAAILHYQHRRAERIEASVLLLDAGASHEGYASDITRTWTRDGVDPVFQEIVRALDALEQRLVRMVGPGRPYAEIHVEAHRLVAEALVAAGVFTVSAEEALDAELTRVFLPHGVGHHLGLQVHDVGGHMAGPEGGSVPPPAEHPYLRNTRILEPGHVVTIEPGIYFIEMLLDPLRESDKASMLDWALVDRLSAHGGVRIEDDVVCTDSGHEDLTRPLLAGPE